MMKNTKRFLQIIAMILLVTSTGFAQIQVPQPQGLVNDFANKLSPATRKNLEDQIKDFSTKHNIEIAVVTIPFDRLQNNSIEKYTRELAQTWKNNFGYTKLEAVLLVAIKDKKPDGAYGGSTRLEVSRNLETVLSNDAAGEIIRGMREDLKSGQFDNALTKGVESTLLALSMSYGVLPETRADQITGITRTGETVTAKGLSDSGTRNPSANQKVSSNDSGWPFSTPVLLVIGFPFLLFIVFMFFIARALSKSSGSRQSNNTGSHFDASTFTSSESNYQDSSSPSNWHDTTPYSAFSDSSGSSSYSDSSSNSSYSDSSSSSSSSDSSSSSSFADSSSSSSSDSSSSSGGGATDNW